MTPEPPAPQQRDPQPGIVIARPFGIPVYISPYWFLIAGVFILLYSNSLQQAVHGNLRYLVAAVFVVLLYASVLVHELSHCVVALAFGLPVRRVLLYPLGGFSEIEKEAPTPAREFLVAAAGPAISLVLAAVGYGLSKLVPYGTAHVLVTQLMWANLLVGLFNLLPGLPLDGGRMLRAGIWKISRAPRRRDDRRRLDRPCDRRRPADRAVRAVRQGQQHQPDLRRRVAGGHRRLHVAGRRRRRSGSPGSARSCPGCRPGCSPGGRSRSRPACRWPRRSGARTRPRPGRSSWSTTRTSRSRS